MFPYKKSILTALFVFVFSTVCFATASFIEEQMTAEESPPTPMVSENQSEQTQDAGNIEETVRSKYSLGDFDGKDGRPFLLAFCLHEIGYGNDDYTTRPEVLRKFIQELKEQGYDFVDVNDLDAIQKGEEEAPSKMAFLGFDDGYKDNYTTAYPILKSEGVKATFFIVSGSIGKENRMTHEDIKDLIANGYAIGSHTVNHYDLVELPPDVLRKELNDSKYKLEHDFGIKVNSIAYPGGYVNQDVVDMAAQYYSVGILANMKDEVPPSNMAIPRYGIFRWHDSIYQVIKQ